MINRLSLLTLALMVSFISKAQLSVAFPPESSAPVQSKVKIVDNGAEDKSTPCGVDTLYYSRHNNTGFSPQFITVPNGAGMYFAIDDTVWLHGFNFFAYATTSVGFFTSQNVNCKVYYANANKLPAGIPLANKSYTITSTGTSIAQLRQKFLFNAPVMLVSDFIVTYEVPTTTNRVVSVSNDYRAGDGMGKQYTAVKIGSNWANNLVINTPTDTVPFDADFYIEPVVEYNMSPRFDHGPNSCLGNGLPFEFINTTTFATNPQFSPEFLDSTMEDNFIWDYGDGSAEDTALNGNHSYIGSLGYWIKLSASFTNWRGKTCKADSSSFLDVGNVKANFQYTSNQKLVSFTDKSVNAKSWEWDFGDGSLKSLQTNPSHLYATYGIYAVKLKVRNKGCLDSSIFVVNLKQSGIETADGNEFKAEISPNPARGEFNISSNLSETGEGQWSLYSIQGKLVKSGKLIEKTTVAVDEVDPGVYFVRLESGRAVLTRRLVIQ